MSNIFLILVTHVQLFICHPDCSWTDVNDSLSQKETETDFICWQKKQKKNVCHLWCLSKLRLRNSIRATRRKNNNNDNIIFFNLKIKWKFWDSSCTLKNVVDVKNTQVCEYKWFVHYIITSKQSRWVKCQEWSGEPLCASQLKFFPSRQFPDYWDRTWWDTPVFSNLHLSVGKWRNPPSIFLIKKSPHY